MLLNIRQPPVEHLHTYRVVDIIALTFFSSLSENDPLCELCWRRIFKMAMSSVTRCFVESSKIGKYLVPFWNALVVMRLCVKIRMVDYKTSKGWMRRKLTKSPSRYNSDQRRSGWDGRNGFDGEKGVPTFPPPWSMLSLIILSPCFKAWTKFASDRVTTTCGASVTSLQAK